MRSIRGGFTMLIKQQFPERQDKAKAIALKILRQPTVNLYGYGTGAFGWARDVSRSTFGIRRACQKRMCLLGRSALSGFLIYPRQG